MYEAHFELDTLDVIKHARLPKQVEDHASTACVHALCQAVLAIDLIFLRAFPQTPHLYASGVKYRRQQLNRDRWFDIPRVLRNGCGSCEDLAPWRVAELQLAGEPANVVVTMTEATVGAQPLIMYHVLVQRGDGSTEDPSAILGMDRIPQNQILTTSGGNGCGL